MIKILHLSDLHIVEDSYWQNLKSLFFKMAKEEFSTLDEGNKLLVITGDFCFYNDKTKYQNSADFIRELTHKMGIDIKQDVFIIPGNHDLSLSSDPKQKLMHEVFMKYVKRDGNTMLQDDTAIDILYDSFSEYSKFCKELGIYEGESTPEMAHVRLWRNRLNIIHINTCLVADDIDKEYQCADIKKLSKIEINNGLPSIALGHNNYFDLREDVRVSLSAVFNRTDVRAYLCGDRHKVEKNRDDQLIRLLEGYGKTKTKSIPNIVCCRSSADFKDDYSDVGCIIHEWDEESGQVSFVINKWESLKDQCKFEPKIEHEAYYLGALNENPIVPDKKMNYSSVGGCKVLCDDLECPCGGYYGREELLKDMKNYILGGEKSLIWLHGSFGEGKTALIYNLIKMMGQGNYFGFKLIFYWKFSCSDSDYSLPNTNMSQFLETFLAAFDKNNMEYDDMRRAQMLIDLMNRNKVLLILENMEVFQDGNGKLLSTNSIIRLLLRRVGITRPEAGSVVLLSSILPIDYSEFFGDNNTITVSLPKLTEKECARIFKDKNIRGKKEELYVAARNVKCNPLAAIMLSEILHKKCNGMANRLMEIQMLNDADTERIPINNLLRYYEDYSDEYNLLMLLSLSRHRISYEQIVYVAKQIKMFKGLANIERIADIINNLKMTGIVTNTKVSMDVHVIARVYYYRKFRKIYTEDFKTANICIAQYCLKDFDDNNVHSVKDMQPVYDAIYHYSEAGELKSALNSYWNRLCRKRRFFSQKELGAFCSDLGAVSSFFNPNSNWEPKKGLSETETAWICSSAAYLLNILGALGVSERLRRQDICIHEKLGNKKLLISDTINLTSNLIIQRDLDNAEKELQKAENLLNTLDDDIPAEEHFEATNDKISAETLAKGITTDVLKNNIYINKAILAFWKSRENSETILNFITRVENIKSLSCRSAFSYFFLHLYCCKEINASQVDAMLMQKRTLSATSYAHAIYAVDYYFKEEKAKSLEMIEKAAENARAFNRLDQLTAILLLRLYIYNAVSPHDNAILEKIDELDELLSAYNLPLYMTDFNVKRIEILIDLGEFEKAEQALNELEETTYSNRLEKCREKLNNKLQGDNLK